MTKRLFIISNRLPITVDEERGIQQGTGGLVTAVNSYLMGEDASDFREVFWAGVPGCPPATWSLLKREIGTTNFDYLPVFVPQSDYEEFYNGHANSVLWPLFHYFPSYAEYDVNAYESFQRVNQLFADAVLNMLRPTDTVWIHDYHLLPLAGILRQQMPELTIGFFLHIPFPSFELFRLLPRKWQRELLEGMLGADLIGFHTIDYASHFLQSILMILGLDNDRHIINYDSRLIKVDVFPISVDFKKFQSAASTPKVRELREDFLRKMNNRKIIFSVDRLDYTKGVQNRLKAFEYFLQQYPEYHERVVFILVIVPSRDTIAKYAERKRQIDESISNINSKIGNIHWVPVIYQYNYLEFDEMVALYSSCDLALITPLRDGMNLVSKEFVSSRVDKRGVLIISEMAGAARELTDAFTINPNDVLEISDKIKEGLEMDAGEQQARMENMQKRIANYDVNIWANDFMNELIHIKQKQQQFQTKFLDEFTKRTIYDVYRASRKRLLLLDYDGTLVPFTSNPEYAIPDENLLRLLNDLCMVTENEVFLISGRSSAWLEKHFGTLPINLVAEHGARYKQKSAQWISEVQVQQEWKEQIYSIMEMFVRRCANSSIEEKEFSMVWHYRNANFDQGKLRASELVGELNEHIRNRPLQVMMGNKIVEVRQSGINKGSFIKRVIEHTQYDFIFAAGDDRTDEDMFKTLMNKNNTFSIKVGAEASYAKYNLHTPAMVNALLQGLNHYSTHNSIKEELLK